MYTEETASPGFWKSEIVGVMGTVLIGAPFVLPSGTAIVYTNWLVGLVAANAAIAMSGNQKWERPVAGAAAIWLFMSGFVSSLVSGPWMRAHELTVGAVLLLSAIAAYLHLRRDVRQSRPLTM